MYKRFICELSLRVKYINILILLLLLIQYYLSFMRYVINFARKTIHAVTFSFHLEYYNL